MKTLKSITVIALFLLATSFTSFANENKPSNTKDALRTEIISIIGDQVPVSFSSSSINAQISFIINDKNELVVLSVESLNDVLDVFIKTKLNYKKVVVPGAKKGEVYILPLKVKKA